MSCWSLKLNIVRIIFSTTFKYVENCIEKLIALFEHIFWDYVLRVFISCCSPWTSQSPGNSAFHPCWCRIPEKLPRNRICDNFEIPICRAANYSVSASTENPKLVLLKKYPLASIWLSVRFRLALRRSGKRALKKNFQQRLTNVLFWNWEMFLYQIVKCICLNCEVYLSEIAKCICLKLQSVFVPNCEVYLSQVAKFVFKKCKFVLHWLSCWYLSKLVNDQFY